MSDSDKLAAILKMADPQSNSSYQERKVALNKAHEIMDKTGMSYASVGMSQAEAERIETQFSFAIGGNQRDERKSLSLFNKKPKRENTGVQKREPETVYVPWSTTSKKTTKKEEPYESYADQCERAEWARIDKQYKDWSAWRSQEDAKNAEIEAAANKVIPYIIFFALLTIGLILYFGVIAPLSM